MSDEDVTLPLIDPLVPLTDAERAMLATMQAVRRRRPRRRRAKSVEIVETIIVKGL